MSVCFTAIDSVKAFTTPQSTTIIEKEGSNCLLDCLVTNPESTEFSLQMENGSAVPSKMNYTADPKRGILIQNLQPSYDGDYVCTVKINGVQKKSDTFRITVMRSESCQSCTQFCTMLLIKNIPRILSCCTNSALPIYLLQKHSSHQRCHFQPISTCELLVKCCISLVTPKTKIIHITSPGAHQKR